MRVRRKVESLLLQLQSAPRISSIALGKVNRLLEQESQLWTFIHDPELPIENNAQERELRSPVIKRKISFDSDSEESARRFADLLSAVLTLERHPRPSLPWLKRLFRGRTFVDPINTEGS